MNIVICGAGMVGSHAAEVLAAAGNNITVIDADADRLRNIKDTMDVSTLCGNCARAPILREAGCENAGLVVAATNSDEINLLSASIAKGVGAKKCVARVHHSAFFENKGLDYRRHFGIDHLICPEYSTAAAIARTIRNPGALAIENFARGKIEMEEFAVGPKAPAVGKPLAQINLPGGTRLAVIRRNGDVFLPDATSVIEPTDIVILVGNAGAFQEARALFQDGKPKRRRVVIMGGPAMAVWLCRALRERSFLIRLFETNRARAEELADKLDWVTVIHADPTDPGVFEEEHIANADVFVTLLDDDEHNILSCAWAKSMGVKRAVAVVQRPNYLHLLEHVGIDNALSPRQVAVAEITRLLLDKGLRRMSSLAEGIVDVYWVKVGAGAKITDQPLKRVKLSPNWMVAAIEHQQNVKVPGADDVICVGDTVLVVGRHGLEGKLRKLFGAG